MSNRLGLKGHVRERFRKFWRFVREISGDDAYERYVKRHVQNHPGLPPLARQAFFAAEQERKWNGIKRCC